jgi:iron complex outermembrane receptor protein
MIHRSILAAFAAPVAMTYGVARAQEAPAPAPVAAETVTQVASAAPVSAATEPASATSAPAAAEQVSETPAPASAAPATFAAPKAEHGVSTVVVSARRKKEKIQDVPASITAISAKEIENMKIDTVVDVGQSAPNVQVSQQGGALAPEFHIRGISNGSLNVQVDSGIGVYVDGVYLGRLGAAAFEVADLAQIEIMRGPQGTLFGRNSTGGAINLITSDPSGTTGISVEAGFGNYHDRHQKVSIDFPAVAGLAARLTVAHRENQGYVTNTAPIQTFKITGLGDFTTARNAPASDVDSALLALQYKGVKDLVVDYKFDYNRSTQSINFRQILNMDSTVTGGFPAVDVPVGFAYRDNLPATFESPATMKVNGHSLRLTYALGSGVSAKYIGAYREYKLNYGLNGVFGAGLWTDGTSYGAPMLATRREHQHQSSHEVQLLGNHGAFDWIGGLFYFEEYAGVDNPVMLPALGFPGLKPGVAYTINPDTDYYIGQKDQAINKSVAAYAHANYTLTDSWIISGGLRHTRDDRKEHVDYAGRLAFGSTVLVPGFVDRDFSYSGSHTDYDLSATYKFNKDTSAYLKYSTGYVSGGTLMGVSFLPETVKSIEAGVKSVMLDNRLRTDLAIFQMKRNDQQIEGFGASGYNMANAGTGTIKGLEFEATYKPVDNLTLNGSLGLSNVHNSGQYRTYQPKHTASFGVEYVFPRFGDGIVPTFRVDGTYMSESNRLNCPAGMDAMRNECTGTANLPLDAQAVIPATKLLNARMTFSNIAVASGSGKLSFWARNLLDRRNSSYMYSLGGNTVSGIFQAPRTFGMDFSVSF